MIKKNIIVSCKTKQDWIKVIKKILREGNVWIYSDSKKIRSFVWGGYKSESCIAILEEYDFKIIYGYKSYYQKYNSKIPIISAKKFLAMKPTKKSKAVVIKYLVTIKVKELK